MKRLSVLLIASLLVVAACGDDGHHHHEGDEHLFCQGDEDTIAVGLSRLGEDGNFKIEILDWDPDPLIVGNNSLTLLVTDDQDVPVDGITFDTAETWQRVHDHGSPVVPVITELANVGEFQIDDLNVIHTGSWLFRFGPTDGVVSDYIVFNFGVQCPPPE
jgi:hypothetical protein